MRTMYNVGQTVYFFDPNEEAVASAQIEMIMCTSDGVFYKIGKGTLPERQLYSCELQCRNHYKELFCK